MGNLLNQILADPEAPAFLALIAILAGVVIAIVAVTWQGSVRAMREFLAPLRLKRFRFDLRTLFLVTTLFSVLLKIVLWLDLLPDGHWVNTVTILALAGILVGMVGFVVCSFAETYEPRPRIDGSAMIPDSEDDLENTGKEVTKRKSVRFRQGKRWTIPFRW